ncbi:hypothetical protein SEA_PIPER2020_92 [Mycobacterium phage Piper2020]|nr:hypothetical protein SEA_MISHA28_87 [Mycobacterium phage Misha28]AVP42472.1 hypothetical protein SEA_TOOTSIEPOP_87 [Mycobacterium phage TootsiePop]QBP31770.1 hypothetical protein SEA_PIPER2020_92 [Mycobacterium phage Piper2020]
MRKRIALALIKLAHKVYPPKVAETTAGMSAAAQAGIEIANRAITFASNAANDASDAVLFAASDAGGRGCGPAACGMPHPGGRFGQVCTRPTGHDGRHGWAGIFWDDPGYTAARIAAEERIAKRIAAGLAGERPK